VEEKLRVEVEVTITDGLSKIQVNQESEQDLSPDMIAMVLAGGLALAIRLSEDEAQTMKDVIEYLNNEFIDPDAFFDARIVQQ
jgi:hypothetical protein